MLRFSLQNDPRSALVSGVASPSFPAVTASLLQSIAGWKLAVLVDRDLKSAEQWAVDTRFFAAQDAATPNWESFAYPGLPDTEADDDPRIFEILCDRLTVHAELLRRRNRESDTPLVLALTPDSLFSAALPPDEQQRGALTLQSGDKVGFAPLIRKLTENFDYDSEAICEQPGQFAVRGGLIDLYPLNADQPYRIDFFDDEIESIRSFDPTTQRTIEAVERIQVLTGRQEPDASRAGALIDYFPESVLWIFKEPDDLEHHSPSYFQIPEKSGYRSIGFENPRTRPGGDSDQWFGLCEIDTGTTIFDQPPVQIPLRTEPLADYRRYPETADIGLDRFESEQSARRQFLLQLLDWQREGLPVWLVTRNEAAESRLRETLTQDPVLCKLKPRYLRGELQEGFLLRSLPETRFLSSTLPSSGFVLATDHEIFGRTRRRLSRLQSRKLPEQSQVDQLLDFSELADGDPIVHLQNGICLFRGLTPMEIDGKTKEVISLEFAEGAMLHVPLHESHLLTRYVGLTKSAPKLAKLGSRTWEKTRAAAEKATLDFASELLNLQARRDSASGHAFSLEHHWLQEFENAFIFKETPDQWSAIQETQKDMARERPMDRLVCGDVGFGKTEVALRAAFLAILNGKQVAVLVPTTVLCQQHYNTFAERMADYPVIVEMVSRFRTPAQNRRILQQAREGKVDILIGTHRMLSEDVAFRKLGLLVIDEEQRFGVRQKESLKSLKEQVDVLTLSATPIPRTLYLALVGAREMSVIETPPRDRLPIHTVVKSYDSDLVRRAIRQEMDRGGQVFYLHNRVQTINRVAARLEAWFPDLRIAVGHGQMDEALLERIMTRFVAGEFDVLVCTTIIESGIDIPNCNTMIIEGADRFGLAQLYQLRGRVGRFKRQAYCYLLLHQKTHLKDDARKRLFSIRQYNQLGAGFRIAMRDLELRGAGNLLGAEQSGHIAGVGFDLYCQLLRQSISRLKGESGADAIRAGLRLDFIRIGETEKPPDPAASAAARGGYSVLKDEDLKEERIPPFSVYFPASYIAETRLRIDFYRDLAKAGTPEDLAAIADALEDRFGPLPQPAKGLLLVNEIRVLAEQKGIQMVESEGYRLKLKIARAQNDSFVKVGPRFPRLTRKDPIGRLKEIRSVLLRIPVQS